MTVGHGVQSRCRPSVTGMVTVAHGVPSRCPPSFKGQVRFLSSFSAQKSFLGRDFSGLNDESPPRVCVGVSSIRTLPAPLGMRTLHPGYVCIWRLPRETYHTVALLQLEKVLKIRQRVRLGVPSRRTRSTWYLDLYFTGGGCGHLFEIVSFRSGLC